MRSLNELFVALGESAFRRRFHLGAEERRYLATHGLDAVLVQAEELIARRLAPAEQDRPDQAVAVVAAEYRQPEEPRRDDDPHPLDAHGLGVEVEPVEPGLCTSEGGPVLRAHDPVVGDRIR